MTDSAITLHHGDCLDVLDRLPAESVHAVITDPPYHLTSIVRRFGGEGAAPARPGEAAHHTGAYARASRGFMGQTWDGGDVAFRAETWAKVLRVLKPGGHLAAFNHSRTYHRMAAAIEAAGFETRDSFLNLYSAGGAWAAFLDSLSEDQADALGRALAGADRALLAWLYGSGFPKSHDLAKGIDKALGRTGAFGGPKSAAHAGWIDRGRMRGEAGTAAGHDGWQSPWMDDPEAVDRNAREYLPATPEAAAWKGWGTALSAAMEPIILARKPIGEGAVARQVLATGTGALNIDAARIPAEGKARQSGNRKAANGWGEAQSKALPADRWPANVIHDGSPEAARYFPRDNSADAQSFFYCAKADKADRRGSDHPTVKPQSLMRWLVRLLTAPGQIVLDPFAGSGSTGWAAATEARRAILIERQAEHATHIRALIDRAPERPRAPQAAPAQPTLL